jgi:hypothetical protein
MFIITIIFGIIATSHSNWGYWSMLAWAVPLGIFLVLFFLSLMLQSHILYKQKANKVQEYETEAIELEGNCRREIMQGIGEVWVARVGVKALGKKAIQNVFVYLRYIDGNQNDMFDAPLHPAGQLRNATGAINVNPGDTHRFVEVLHWRPSIPEMGIPYNLNCQLRGSGVDLRTSRDSLPDAVDIGPHIIGLYATGENINPIERGFKVEIVNNQLEMHRLVNE